MNRASTKTKFFIFLFFLSGVFANAQDFSAGTSPTTWSSTWQPSKFFIENKGQFKLPASSDIKSTVNYAYDEGSTKIYFTQKGLVYSFTEKKKKRDREEEREREEKFKNEKEFLEKEREEKAISYKTDVISMEWEGANEHAEIITENKSSEYFSYAYNEKGEQKNENFIYGYKKLTYKNLYPNIDVEYVFHPTDGIKYSFILHPGADISLIKMKYSDRVKLKSNGEIHISTKFDDIIEHAPQSFYASNKSTSITSQFIKTGQTISFQLGDYDKSKDLVIDPWVQTPTIANSNCVWECEKDGAGNIYIIGGDQPMKLLKYNATGTLQWTFATAYDTGSVGGNNGDWLGTFATDLAGNSYVTCGSTAAITKVNSAGAQVYSVTGGSTDEYWNIAFNCDQTKLVVGGTRLTGLPSITGGGVIFDINTANGSVTSTKTVGYTVPGFGGLANPDEVRSVTSSYNARYYYLTLDSIGAIDQNFSACPTATTLFKTNHAYSFGYKCENYRPNNGNAGIMGIRANRNFVYTQNGKTIHKRALGSGAILATATIPGGISTASGGLNQAGNSGIDIDSCGNVYVGSGNAVVKYDANLNQLSSTALPFAVYDVAVTYGGNVVVSGSTGTSASTVRTGYVQSINMSACNPMTLFCCDATICPAGPFCTTAPSVTLTPVTAGGTWSGVGVNASGVFNPATAGPGIHTIIYTLACGSDSIQIKVNPCATLTVCQNAGNITASGGTPGYTWQTSTTYTDCSSCFGGNCIPGFCNGVVTTSLTTIATNTNTIAAPASYPLIITDAVGNTYTVTSLGSLPPCSACAPPTPSVTATNSVTCFGAHTGSGTVTATPVGTYTYTWQPGNLNGASQTGLAAGVYTVSVSSSATCSGTITVNITQPASALSASITATSPSSCGQNNGSITVSPSGGTSGYTYTWTPSGGNTTIASNLAGGNYTVIVSDANSCTTTATASVSTTPTPTLTVNSATICSGNTATLTVSGATNYTWSPATNLSSTTSAIVVASPTTTTVYTVTGASGTCSSTATSTVTVNSTPTATATGTQLVCIGQSINLGVTTTATTFAWSGPNTFTSNIQNPTITNAAVNNSGVYTVTVTANGCTAVSSISVTVTNSTSVTITPAGPFCSGGAATTLTASVAGGTWIGTGITNANNGTFNPAVAGVGTYTITYTIGGSCGSSDSTVITVNHGPTATATTSTSLVCAGQTINLGVNATAGATYSWSGPSTYTSNVQNPTITNASPANSGIYTVTVNSGTCSGVDTVSVTVVSNPTITVNSATLCAGVSATLTANGAANYTWTPATGLSTTTGSVVVANPASTSVYTITGGVGTCAAIPATSTVTINPSPTITVNNASICSSTSVTITVNGASSYSWSPAAGLSSTVGSMVVASPGASTNYTIVGTSVDGCQGTATVTVLNSPAITTTVTSHSVTCHGLGNGSATVTAGGGTGAFTYSWSPIGGINSSATNISAGNYTCLVTDGIGCTTSATVSIIQPQNIMVNANSGLVCAGQSYPLNAIVTGGTSPYTYNWNNGASTTNPYVVSLTSAASYTVMVIDVNGCTATDTSIVIAVRPPLQVLVGDAYICAGNTTTLTAIASGGNGSYNYNWMPGSLSGSIVAVSPASTTIYTVTVSDGCTATPANDTGMVTVTPPPLIPLPTPGSGCAPICVSFTSPPSLINWVWNFGDNTTSSQPNPTHCYTIAGSYTISLSYTTNIGCVSTVTENNFVTIFPVPKAWFTSSPNPANILDPQVFFSNQSINSTSWQWTFGDGSSSVAQDPSHTYGAIGVYPVMLIAQSQQGCSDTLKTSITINDIFTFYAPNAFSPNDDNINQKFLPIGEAWNDKTYNLWVFDRWGNNIFKTQDPNQGWDGRVNSRGSVVQEDVYVWKVQLNDIFGKQHQYTGTVTLVK